MRPVNLIPPEERRGERTPLRAGILSYAIVGLLALALVGVVSLVLTGNKISEKESELAGLETRQLAAEQRAQELAPYGEFATLAESRRETISSLANSRFDWERVMNELARVIPEDVWLDNLTGSVAPGVSAGGDGGEAGVDPSIMGPSLRITGCADGQVAVARLVSALKDIDGVTRVGMHSSALGDASGTTATPAAPPAGGESGGCQTREFIAAFQITLAFDAVPPPAYSASSSSATPAVVPTDPATATPESEEAADSAAAQGTEAGEAAATVGAGQ